MSTELNDHQNIIHRNTLESNLKASNHPNNRLRSGFFSKAVGLLLQWLKSVCSQSGRTNCFFSVEEQRKFQLECEFKRHWPNHLLNQSFISRHDY